MSHLYEDEEDYEENGYDDSETQDVGGDFNIQQDDDSETQDVGGMFHQQDDVNVSSEAPGGIKKHRGPKQKNWAMEGREKLLWNRFGLPKGPRLKVARFSRFLGILAKDFTLFPISTPDYRHFKLVTILQGLGIVLRKLLIGLILGLQVWKVKSRKG
ncbi:uncharacterized protein LOC121049070 [Rosa chinensis]|uniref:uncharacterized protein LOC121049070 n=1 Tax=Rosa chinensis TaxID=74649 RepID=UPI001AD8B7DE|nr:uncharacterized protein LOC121049070 [Rosa chinensis]